MSELQILEHTDVFKLEAGGHLDSLKIAYHTFGKRLPDDSNVVWVFHALTANSNPLEWWPGMMGSGKFFDPEKYFIICANIPGSCYGSTGPEDINMTSGKVWRNDFPLISIRDIVKVFEILRKHLQISRIHIAIGGSLGGYQALEWAIMKPGLIENLIPIASGINASPWFKAINQSQRMALEADESFIRGEEHGGKKGLAAARAITMSFFRSYSAFGKTQKDTDDHIFEGFRASSYQKYQGEKLVKRFSPYAYYAITRLVDSHNLARGRGNAIDALQKITSKSLCIGIKNDLLIPAEESKFLAENIPDGTYAEIETEWGHDGFLIETVKLSRILQDFLS
ncbi:MAG: homoserine O-acetyltransferase [Bacteroidales bacterium]|nr:homoserine O-acetyltransferase [Bacteroidales bacterium]